MEPEQYKAHQLADHLFRHESGKMVAILTRIFGLHNLDLVEDVVQEAFTLALQNWAFHPPDNPAGWLMQVARNKAIDVIRRDRYKKDFAAENAALLKSEYTTSPVVDKLFLEHEIEDSQLRMIFACCHPALPEADQIALTLKTCSGFTTQEIAAALRSNSETIKKRLQRSRAFISGNEVRFDIPTGTELQRRLDIVLRTLYLIFNEGYNSGNKETLIRKDLCHEALRLALQLTRHKFTNFPRCNALVALMALLVARFDSRVDEVGDIILLGDQDRAKWNSELLDIGEIYLERASEGEDVSEYHLQAAIVAEHSRASNLDSTNWDWVLTLYDHLIRLHPSPTALLSRAVVVSRIHGPEQAISDILAFDDIDKLLASHYLFASVLGELYFQSGNTSKAAHYLAQAIELTSSTAQKNLIRRKLDVIGTSQ